jgi:protein-S-isoprenylcysteine O-methyltransferase Ste14
MLAVIGGCLGFALLSVADECSLRGARLGKGVAFLGSAGLLSVSLVWAALAPPRLVVPRLWVIVGWSLGALTLLLTVAAVFLEAPTLRIYLGAGGPRGLVTRGSYALCRHPGVMWLSLFLISLALVSGSLHLVVAAPLWIAMDVAHVAWQEKHYLVPTFGDEYRGYQARVPMLIPTLTSIRRALRTPQPNEEE